MKKIIAPLCVGIVAGFSYYFLTKDKEKPDNKKDEIKNLKSLLKDLKESLNETA